MSSEEKVPLVPTTSKEPSRGSGNDGYLLLSMPSSENGFVKKLKYVGNHTGLIVGIVAVITIITLIVIITYFADVTELVNRGSSRNPLQQDTPFRTVEISTPLGALKGYVKQSRQGRGYLAFYKVPYAQPPIGQLRFKVKVKFVTNMHHVLQRNTIMNACFIVVSTTGRKMGGTSRLQ